MKLTNKQKKELEVWNYYAPKNCKWDEYNEKDVFCFFEWSEQGKHKERANLLTYLPEGRSYFHKLLWGKKWADVHIGMYEEGILSFSTFYLEILQNPIKLNWLKRKLLGWGFPIKIYSKIPESVMKFLAKGMFGGMDKEMIEECYYSIK